VYGRLDEGILGVAMTKVGQPNPLPTEWLNRPIPLRIDGKLQVEGVTASCYQPVGPWFIVGGSMVFMRVNSRNEFKVRDRADTQGYDSLGNDLSPTDAQLLDFSLRQMFNEVSLRENHSVQTGMGDIDLFIGARGTWDFTCKFRRIDGDIRLGTYIPSGLRRSIDVPASIPFGGDGHWGVYLDTSWLFEIKEDIKLSILGRVIKRSPRTLTERIVVNGEPLIFGAAVGSVHRNPGITYVFNPVLALEHLRAGLGLSIGYTLVHHRRDRWCDNRSPENQEAIPAQFGQVERYSAWGDDYATISVFYELDWLCRQEYLVPTISFRWEIPATLWVSGLSSKTHAIFAGVEFAF